MVRAVIETKLKSTSENEILNIRLTSTDDDSRTLTFCKHGDILLRSISPIIIASNNIYFTWKLITLGFSRERFI